MTVFIDWKTRDFRKRKLYKNQNLIITRLKSNLINFDISQSDSKWGLNYFYDVFCCNYRDIVLNNFLICC